MGKEVGTKFTISLLEFCLVYRLLSRLVSLRSTTIPCLKETKWREQEIRGVCSVVDGDLKGILEIERKNNGLMMR